MSDALIQDSVQKIRQFNRFYTQFLGLLNEKLIESDYSLIEARVIFELTRFASVSPVELNEELKIDKGYLSRILANFEKKKLISKSPSKKDARQIIISLTDKGKKVFQDLNQRSNNQLTEILNQLSNNQINKLVSAISEIETILNAHNSQNEQQYIIRSHQPGDIGYLIYLHGNLYAKEYGFNELFDSYVGKGLCNFLENYDSEKEYLWLVEMNDHVVGSVAIVKVDDKTAQLRWLILHPKARGQGLGKRLVHEAIKFSQRKGYEKIILWTVSHLDQARKIYQHFNFTLEEEKTHEIWGQYLTEERWELIISK